MLQVALTLALMKQRKEELKAALESAIEDQEPAAVVKALTDQFKQVSQELDAGAKSTDTQLYHNVCLVVPSEYASYWYGRHGPFIQHRWDTVTHGQLKHQLQHYHAFTLLPVEALPASEAVGKLDWPLMSIDDVPIKNDHMYFAVGRRLVNPAAHNIPLVAGAVAGVSDLVHKWRKNALQQVTTWLQQQGYRDVHQLPISKGDQASTQVHGIIVTSDTAFVVEVQHALSDYTLKQLHEKLQYFRSPLRRWKYKELTDLKITGIACGERLAYRPSEPWKTYTTCAEYGYQMLCLSDTGLGVSTSPLPPKLLASRSMLMRTSDSAVPASVMQKGRAASMNGLTNKGLADKPIVTASAIRDRAAVFSSRASSRCTARAAARVSLLEAAPAGRLRSAARVQRSALHW